MPPDPIAVVKANNNAFSRMDVDGMLALYAPDAVVIDRRRVSLGSFRGHDELRAYYLSIFHSASELREDLTVLAHDGDVVVAGCEITGRLAAAPANSAEIVVPYGLVIDVREGRIVRLELFESGDDALALSGLAGRGEQL
jgi:ketosteroid isomerase-like protein